MRVGTVEMGTRRLIVFMKHHLRLLVSMVVPDGYGIHIRSRMRAGSTEIDTRRLIVFMEYHLGPLVSMAVLNVTFTVAAECALVQQRYPASNDVHVMVDIRFIPVFRVLMVHHGIAAP